ncbi:hypothetical protein CCR94_15080 [Rhodoblastus sphagnicola]|uniref:DUF2155 domain-containing protein n=1 Tax=Rhodoblastus sphagnicola TaxID=333368 RepID=A0A2S6N4J0_9HYPH|nr:DUF2155 domain-containing protein [Rhodoblastus sphagnicola]MBB4196376.1 hypothetical protein [Rhodoblastus sphagnicola]PPQ29541.1 hypothetical protein CCR94_15080 [Rhodoblastus sphagnicola]
MRKLSLTVLRPALALAAGLAAALPARADEIRNPNAVFAGLDKITGRIISFDVAIDETVQFGTLQITPRVCLTRPQTEAPLTEGFVEVDDIDAKSAKRVFSGWMFSASPGLHGVEHPVYDVWLKDCKGGKDVVASPVSPAPNVNAPPPANAQAAPTPGRKPRILKPQEPEEPKVEVPSAADPGPVAPADPAQGPVELAPSAPVGAAPLPPPVEVGAPPGAGPAANPAAAPSKPKKPKKPKPQPAPQQAPGAERLPLQAPPEPRRDRDGFPGIRDLF